MKCVCIEITGGGVRHTCRETFTVENHNGNNKKTENLKKQTNNVMQLIEAASLTRGRLQYLMHMST